jgi:hypothetical protein
LPGRDIEMADGQGGQRVENRDEPEGDDDNACDQANGNVVERPWALGKITCISDGTVDHGKIMEPTCERYCDDEKRITVGTYLLKKSILFNTGKRAILILWMINRYLIDERLFQIYPQNSSAIAFFISSSKGLDALEKWFPYVLGSAGRTPWAIMIVSDEGQAISPLVEKEIRERVTNLSVRGNVPIAVFIDISRKW